MLRIENKIVTFYLPRVLKFMLFILICLLFILQMDLRLKRLVSKCCTTILARGQFMP